MKLVFTTRGVTNIQSAAKYVQRIVGEGLELIATAGALEIENKCKEYCPVLTGTLRRSIHHETIDRSPIRARVAVGPDSSVTYAGYVEFGTRFMAAEPYMRPGFDAGKPLAIDAMARDAQEVIVQAVDQAAQAGSRGR